MIVLVCGGRHYDDRERVFAELDARKPHAVIHGGAAGADALAHAWATERGAAVYVYPADWKAHGRGAGPIRNQQMVDRLSVSFDPRVLAFPGGRGTADLVNRAKLAGLKVEVVS